MSALLTTTMTYMKTVIDGFEKPGYDHIKMAIGGAPISQMFADEIGADGYGADASGAVDLFLYLVGKGAAPKLPRSRPVLARPRPSPAAVTRRSADRTPCRVFQILYWQDLPSEIKAWDDFEEIKVSPCRPGSPSGSMRRRSDFGHTKGDDYLAQLKLERRGRATPARPARSRPPSARRVRRPTFHER